MNRPLPGLVFDVLSVATCLAAAAVHLRRTDYTMSVLALGYAGLMASNIMKDQRIDQLERELAVRPR